MGNLIMWGDVEISDIAKGRWKLTRQLLPVLLSYLNESMARRWAAGIQRNVTISADAVVSPTLDEPALVPAGMEPFAVERLVDDQSESFDEIYIVDPDEFERLFRWCAFLSSIDGAFELFAPLVALLETRFRVRNPTKE